jgi:type II secretory pathway pseudopilin PulG
VRERMGHGPRRPEACPEACGFTLVELMISMAILMVVLSVVSLSIVAFDRQGKGAANEAGAERRVEEAVSLLEQELTTAVPNCSGTSSATPPISKALPNRMTFTSAVGPGLGSPPEELEASVLPSGTTPTGTPLYRFVLEAYDPTGGTSGCESYVDASPRLLTVDDDLIANADGNPWFRYCSAPGTMGSAPGTMGGQYVATGVDLEQGTPPSVPQSSLRLVASVQVELTALVKGSPPVVVRTTIPLLNVQGPITGSESASSLPSDPPCPS